MASKLQYPILFQKDKKDMTDTVSESDTTIVISESDDTEKKTDDIVYDSEFSDDCPTYDLLPHILPATKRIIAIGDLHGDYDLTIDCLKLAKLIDDNLNWIAKPKNTIVVQIGDQVDRCRPEPGKKCTDPDTTPNDEGRDIDILELFNELHKKAKKYGGGVYSLLGNHEIMNVDGDLNYVSYQGFEQFKDEINPKTHKKFESGMDARKFLFKKGNKFAKLLACTRQTAIIIGSNLFVHASIVPKLAKKYDVKDINVLIRKWLLAEFDENKPIEGIGNLRDILRGYEYSPFWPRLLGNLPNDISLDNKKCIKYLKETLDLYKCNNMIIGHTPQFIPNNSGISSTCTGVNEQNKQKVGVWRIDTGSSKAFEKFDKSKKSGQREPQILEILNDNDFNVIK